MFTLKKACEVNQVIKGRQISAAKIRLCRQIPSYFFLHKLNNEFLRVHFLVVVNQEFFGV